MKDGGPAFPTLDEVKFEGNVIESTVVHGMSLRDYFAEGRMPTTKDKYFLTEDEWMIHAIAAYRAADAMLKAREE